MITSSPPCYGKDPPRYNEYSVQHKPPTEDTLNAGQQFQSGDVKPRIQTSESLNYPPATRIGRPESVAGKGACRGKTARV